MVGGMKFDALVHKLSGRKRVRNPKASAASIERRAMGKPRRPAKERSR